MFGEILALNFDCLGSPSIYFPSNENPKTVKMTGWGFGWYPNDDYGASVVKDGMAKDSQTLLGTLKDGSSFRSTMFACKVKGVGRQYTQHDSQPFRRSFGGHDWLFLHNGQLDSTALEEAHSDTSGLFEPVGKTDSELAFCFLLGKFLESSAKALTEVDGTVLLSWLEQLDAMGSADFVICDGRSMAVYHGKNSKSILYTHRILPSEKPPVFESDIVSLDLEDPRDSLRTVFMVTSFQFKETPFDLMELGRLIIIRKGAIYWDSFPEKEKTKASSEASSTITETLIPAEISATSPATPEASSTITEASPLIAESPATPEAKETSQPVSSDESLETEEEFFASQQQEQSQTSVNSVVETDTSLTAENFSKAINIKSLTHDMEGVPLSYRFYNISHITEYSYADPVEHSSHFFRLQPVEDAVQEVVHATLEISVDGEMLAFEDVFANHALYYDITSTYNKLMIKMKSQVKVYARPQDNHNPVMRRSQIPLTWMPWQRQMMLPYLLPPELPETQLRQLTDYAMSFVKRNDLHLIDTLLDINKRIYEDFSYVPGSTFLETTPFDVFSTRKGVCQDFANLFICLCRLLNIPARYRVGYIYTGGNYENKIQSDASHAWTEVYLPYIGWRGFDPTNGCVVSQDHIRTACGRNYRDATPVSGTIFKGGNSEKLRVEVKVKEVES